MDIQLNTKKLPAPVNIQITFPKEQGTLVLTWNMVRGIDENTNPQYNVYRGISSNSIFYKLNSTPLLNNKYEEKDLSKNPNTQYWYKVSTVYKDKDGKSIEGPLSSPIVYQVNNTNYWFGKMNERSMWILKNVGELFDLYTRKTDGPKCPKCYDSARGRAGDPNCPVCWGTGFDGGYEPVNQLYLRQKPAQTDLSITNEGFVYNHTPGAWTISKTQIKNRDLLINPRGVIFSVLNSNINQAAGYYFHQELQLKELDPMDNLYKMQRISLHPEF